MVDDAMPSVAVSIVSHGHGTMVSALLQDLNDLQGFRGSKVVVTHNIPEPELPTAELHHLRVQVVRNQAPRGFGANHNAAFAHCDASHWLILNPDIRLSHGDPMPALWQCFAHDHDLAMAAPRIVNEVGALEDAVRENLTLPSLVKRTLLKRPAPLAPTLPSRLGNDFYWLGGMFMLVKRQSFADVGGFDERFFLYCEDYDLCARLALQGNTLVSTPNAQVVHMAQRDSHRSRRHLQWHLQSLAKVWTSGAFWRTLW